MGNGCTGQRIRKADLHFLLEKTTFTEEQIREWYQGFMRDCPTGELSRGKFIIIYQSMFPHGRAAAFYSHVFRTFDRDGSGHIDFKEFLQAIDITQSGRPKDRLDLAFRLYDIDSSGTLEVHEMVELIKAVYLMVEAEEDCDSITERAEQKAKTIFTQIDLNADGHVTRDEFVTSCLKDDTLFEMLATGGQPTDKKEKSSSNLTQNE